MCRYKLINNFISQTSITIIILLSIFAHAAILGSISTPCYYYSPCIFFFFLMEDVNDSTYRRVQIATMDYFLDRNLPFTAGIIVSLFGNSSNLDVFHKVEEGVDKGLFEIAIHGNRHVNHAALSKEEQINDLSFAKGKLEYLFGKRADIFIPPGSEFNLNTIEVMADLNITLLSSSERSEQIISNPYKNQTLVVTNSSKLQVSKISDEKPLVYHAPFSVSFLWLQRQGLSGEELLEESLRLIDESIATYGFAQVRLHPPDFAQVNATTGKGIDELDTIRFQDLTQLVDMLEARNLKIATFSDIYPP